MTPKCPQNDPKIYQNGTLGISGSPLGGPRVPQEAPRPILGPTGSPNEPKITENGSKIFAKQVSKHQCLKKRGSAALAKPSDPPPPGLVPGGNGVVDHLSVFMIFQDLRTCSLRPPPGPPTHLILPRPHLDELVFSCF